MIEQENKIYKLLLIFSTIAVLVLTVTFGIATLFGPKKTDTIDSKTATPIVIPTTIPEFNMELVNKNMTPSCSISESQVEFVSKTNTDARLQLVDTSKPYREGYSLDKIAYLNGFLTDTQPWAKADGSNIGSVFGYACEGFNSREIENISNIKELSFANMMKSKSIYSIDSQIGGGGSLTFNAIGKRGDYIIRLKVQNPLLNAKEAAIAAKCTVNGALDQPCYDKELTSTENKALLSEAATKAILEFNY
jgi:hypothetical protein